MPLLPRRIPCLLVLLLSQGLTAASLAAVSFGTLSVGSSQTQTVTVKLGAAGSLNSIAVRTQGATGLDFTDAGSGTCTVNQTYAAGAQCTVVVSFAPHFAGARYGAVVLSYSTGVAANAYLYGVGLAPQSQMTPGTPKVFSFGFQFPQAIAVDGGGDVLVADIGSGFDGIGDWDINPSVTLFSPSQSGYNESSIGNSFGYPDGLAVDGAGNIYISDLGYFYTGVYSFYAIPTAVYKETLEANGSYSQSFIGGNQYDESGFAVGSWFGSVGVAVDRDGNVYVADSGNVEDGPGGSGAGAVYKLEPQADGSYLQQNIGSGWASPRGVAVDAAGNVYVTEWASQVKGVKGGPAVFKETLQANGKYVQTAIGSGWGGPTSIALDASGSVFVLDGAIFRETLNADGSYSESLIDQTAEWPTGFAMTGSGSFFVSDAVDGQPGDGTFDSIDLSHPPAIVFPATPQGKISGPDTVSLINIGNADLLLSEVSYPAGFTPSAAAGNPCTATTVLAMGSNCLLPIEFQPGDVVTKGSQLFKGDVTVESNSLNAASTEVEIPVSGNEIPPQTTAPEFGLKAGTYHKAREVTISDSMTGASIYYALHGAAPSRYSTPYAGPITVASTETIKAIAIAPDHSPSPIVSALYTIEFPTAAPAFAPPAGAYESGQRVTITDATRSATIYYTLNGKEPTTASARYTGPIKITKKTTIKAMALAPGDSPSAVTEATYTIK